MKRADLARYARSPLEVVRFLFHLPKMAILIHRLLQDKRVSFLAKLIPLAALLYVVLPFDLVRDFPVSLGYVDDVVVVYLLMKAFIRACPPEVVQEHVAKLSLQRKRSS